MYIIYIRYIKRHVFLQERFVKITGRSISIKSYVQSYSCHVDWNSVVWDTSDRYKYIYIYTHIAPENRPLGKAIPFGNHQSPFLGVMVVLGSVMLKQTAIVALKICPSKKARVSSALSN